MRLFWQGACEMVLRILVVILSLLCLAPNTKGAQLYLVQKGASASLVFTSSRRVTYQIKEPHPGKVIVFLKGLKLKAKKRAPINIPTIKSIEIRSDSKGSYITLELPPHYTVKTKESFPPFKLILTPVVMSTEDMIKRMLKQLYDKGECPTFLANFPRLNPKTLSMKELIEFNRMKLTCAEKTGFYPQALEAITLLMRLLPEPEKERLWVKKIAILLKMKDYENTLAEGKLFIQKYTDPLSDLVIAYMARALIRLDRIDDAIVLLKDALKRHPDSPYIDYLYLELGRAYYKKGNFVATYLLLDKVYSHNKKLLESDAEAFFMYGSSTYRVNFKEKARKILLRAFNLHPTGETAAKCLALLGQIYADRNQWKLAEWFYTLCMRLFPDTKAAAASKIKLAEHYEQTGNYRKALNLYTEAEIMYSHMPDILEVALYKKGVMLLRLGKYEEAIQAFKDFIVRVPQSSYLQKVEQYIEEAEFRIAERSFKQKRWEEAVRLLTTFAIRYPQNPFTPQAIKLAGEALVNIVEDKTTRGDCAGIVLFWDTYKNFFPKKANRGIPLFHVTQCLMKKNRSKEAISLMEWIEKNIGTAFPKRKELFTYLVHYYYDTDQYKKAQKAAETLVSVSKASDTPDVHQILAELYFLNGRYQKMLNILSKMEREKAPPRYTVLGHFYKAFYLLEQKKREKGEKELENFVRAKRSLEYYRDKYKLAHILLARMAYNDGKKKESFKRYLTYLNIFPKDTVFTPEALFMVGWINPKVRNPFWNICLAKFPNSHWSKEIKAFELAGAIKDEAERAIGSGKH